MAEVSGAGTSTGTSSAVGYTKEGVFIQLSPIIGDIDLVAGSRTSKARISTSVLIGAVDTVVALRRNAKIQISTLIGYVRPKVKVNVSQWSGVIITGGGPSPPSYDGGGIIISAGLPPCVAKEGYGYSKDQGLVRTTMESGVVRQRRKWTDGYKTTTAKTRMHVSQIKNMEDLLESVDYGWYTMHLVFGDNATSDPEIYTVRTVKAPTIQAVGGNYVDVILSLEVQ